MSGITDIWHENNRSKGDKACMIPVSEIDENGKRSWKGLPSTILYGKSIERIVMPTVTHREMRQTYSQNTDTAYPLIDPGLILKDENEQYVKDYAQDGSLPNGAVASINGCPSDVDPVDIEMGDGVFQYFVTAADPYLYDEYQYEDFNALNKLKESGFVVLDSAYLTYLFQAGLSFTPYRPSLAELVYDKATNITELIVEDSAKNRWSRRFNHQTDSFVSAWVKESLPMSESVANDLALNDPLYTLPALRGSDVWGYMNGQEGLISVTPFRRNMGLSISTGGKNMAIQKSDNSIIAVSSYSSSSPSVKRVLINRDTTSLIAYDYALYGIDLSKLKKLTNLTLVGCRGYSNQKLPASLVTVEFNYDTAYPVIYPGRPMTDQILADIDLPLCTNFTARSHANESISINMPSCTYLMLRGFFNLKKLTILTNMPTIENIIVDYGNQITLDGLVFLSKILNVKGLGLHNANLADINGQHLILPYMPRLYSIGMRNCSLSEASVDSLISFMLDQVQSGRVAANTVVLAIGSDPANNPIDRHNAAPSAAGIANADILRGLGAFVEHM